MTAPTILPRVVWLTGRPAAGKTTLARGLVTALRENGVPTLWLDSDDLREVMTPAPTYTTAERDVFYATLAHVGRRAAQGGVFVVISATANKRRYRDAMRARTENFVEVWVRAPVDVLEDRDPKGLYAKANGGEIAHMPGAGADYEPPHNPEMVFDTNERTPAQLIEELFISLVG